MVFGTLKPALAGISDIGFREAVIFAPLVILTILFGVAPKPVLDMSAASVAQLLDGYNKAIKTAEENSPSFRGASAMSEPGIQNQSKSPDSGSGPAGRPGMTAPVLVIPVSAVR
jgi:hypothetical protein